MSRFSPVLVLMLALLPLAPAAQARQKASLKLSGKTMGPISWNVTIADSGSQSKMMVIESSVQATLDRINSLMSTYQPDSDLSRFNQSDSTDWILVNTETARVVARAQEISEQSGGTFDITVGPAVDAWQFGPSKKATFKVPTDEQIEQLQQRIGYQKVSVRADPPALKKSNPDIQIDLSAIAKGYAVDQVGETLAELGYKNFMVEVGGEVITRGFRESGTKWRIGVEAPAELERKLGKIAELTDIAMATSGDYRNYQAVGAKRFSHTIDPTTARPVEHSLASASVIAPDCMTADAVATAVMVLGAEEGMKLCQKMNLELFTITRNLDFGDKFTESSTEKFPFAAVPQKQQSIWPTFLGALVVFVLVVLGMAVGAIFGNKPVTGSCGGLANMSGDDGGGSCSVCSKPVTDCEKLSQPASH